MPVRQVAGAVLTLLSVIELYTTPFAYLLPCWPDCFQRLVILNEDTEIILDWPG